MVSALVVVPWLLVAWIEASPSHVDTAAFARAKTTLQVFPRRAKHKCASVRLTLSHLCFDMFRVPMDV